ncbi:MAG: TonB-dependent receptor [Verrucomicrobiae bacterium]|nr:TonB-dependent receptor [Verrucomicrobiae bacterium]
MLTSIKNDNIDMAFPLPAAGTVLPNPSGEIPISRYIGNPAYGNDEWERLIRLGYELRHRFSEHLALRHNFRYEQNDWTSDDLAYPSFLEEDQRTLYLSGWKAKGAYKGYRVDTALDATFETGSVEHTLTGGVDYRWTDQGYDGRNSTNDVTLDVFTPDYAAMPPFLYGDPFGYSVTDDDIGFYFQERARLWQRVTVTLGGRYDWTSSADQSADAFSPRVGVTYEFIDGLSAYASYSRSFQPQWDFLDAEGQSVAPARGQNYELGLKSELLDGRLYGLLAIYNLTLKNVATPDLSTPDPNDSVVTGKQRSRGVEIEGGYRFAPGWELIGAYTYVDAEVVEDNTIPAGSRLWGVPKNVFNAWVKYTLQDGVLRGLGVGLGGRYNTRQEGDATYTAPLDIPAYGVMDAAVFYRRGSVQAQVNVNNVLDHRYFVGAYNDVYVLPGEPITVRGSVSWNF